jgi:hypothetical protein
MAGPFHVSLTSLLTCLDEAGGTLAYIRDAIRVQAVLGKALDLQGEQTYEKKLAANFSRQNSPPLRVARNGLYVTIIASFEQFLRETIVVAVQHKIAAARQFKDLGESFINRHIEYSGRLLTMVHRPPAHLGLNFYDLCHCLGTCQQDSITFRVNEVAFANVKGITELESFFEHLTKLGFPVQWDDLGRREAVQSLLHTTRTCDTSKELTRFFTSATTIRNKVAHSGYTVADVDDEVLRRTSDVIRCVATAISEHLASKIGDGQQDKSSVRAGARR